MRRCLDCVHYQRGSRGDCRVSSPSHPPPRCHCLISLPLSLSPTTAPLSGSGPEVLHGTQHWHLAPHLDKQCTPPRRRSPGRFCDLVPPGPQPGKIFLLLLQIPVRVQLDTLQALSLITYTSTPKLDLRLNLLTDSEDGIIVGLYVTRVSHVSQCLQQQPLSLLIASVNSSNA